MPPPDSAPPNDHFRRARAKTNSPNARNEAGVTPSTRRPYREFGAWLRSRRLARRWTQDELARRLDYDVTYVRKIEWGERRPSDALRVRLAQVLAVPVSSLPPSEPVRPPARLPDATGPLIGRADDLAAVTKMFHRGGRLVTILGSPGIGKTRLAVTLAAGFDDALAGGAVFVPLVDVPAASGVGGAIAQALGVAPAADGIGGDPQPLVDALRGQDALLVLDNFEHVIDAAPLVDELLTRVPTLRVLVTSRHPLELRRESQYSLPPLRVPDGPEDGPDRLATVDSVALFVARAERVRPDFVLDDENAVAVAEVCRRLQGIPLALELAAGTARFLTPAALLTQLGEGLDLPVDGPRDAPAHQRTLRAAIGWSFDLLSDTERVVIRRLAVFAGGCTLEAAAEVCWLPGEQRMEPRKTLLALAAKSMLEPVDDRPGSGRLVLLESVRAFALERLAEAGEVEELHRRHAAWFLSLAQAQEQQLTGAGQTCALAVLEVEHANLTAALRWCLEHDPAAALRLCARLWRFWWMRGHLSDGRRWLEAALALPADDAAVHALALTGAGVLARAQAAYDHAVDLLERAAQVSRAAGDRRGLALALLNLGNVSLDRGAPERARALFEEARLLYAAAGDRRGVAHSLNGQGIACLAGGDLNACATLFEEAAAIFRELHDDWSLAMAVANLGWIAHKQARTQVARRLYEKTLAMNRALGDDRAVATTLLNLGITTGDAGDVAGLFAEALLTFFRLGEHRGIAECLEALASTHPAHDATGAATMLGAADAIRRRIGVPPAPEEERALAGRIEALRAAADPGAFEAAWEEGRLLELEEVVTIALADRDGAAAL